MGTLQALTGWLQQNGVVHLVLKSNLHQAQYAEQVLCWMKPSFTLPCSSALAGPLRACRAVVVEAAHRVLYPDSHDLPCCCRHSAC